MINKYNKYKKLYERDQNTIKFFDKLYRKSLQDKVIDKSEDQSLCNIFTKHIDEKKMNLFYKYGYKKKLNFFGHHKLKFQPRT